MLQTDCHLSIALVERQLETCLGSKGILFVKEIVYYAFNSLLYPVICGKILMQHAQIK